MIEDRRARLLDAMARHVLAHGLTSASLRPLARAAGTSDRMLIYHFGSKDSLIAALLQLLADEFAVRLDEALPFARARSMRGLIDAIVELMRRPDMRPYFALWHEIVAAAARGDDRFTTAGRDIITGFADWVAARLPEDVVDRPAQARAMLTLIEGIAVMDAVGRSEIADAAPALLYRVG